MATRSAESEVFKEPRMPKSAVSLQAAPPEAWRWLLRGGLTPEDAEFQYGMQWSAETRRVMIPVYREFILIGIIGRAVFPKDRPKYHMKFGPSDALATFGPPTKTVVVVEDVLSAIAVQRAAGLRSIALLGTSVTALQAARIADGVDRVIGWMDGDAAGDKGFQRLRKRMQLYPVTTYQIRTPVDPKVLHREVIREHVNSI